jgi:hypothetical protein
LPYPISGALYAIFGIIKGLPDTLKSPGIDLIWLFFWILAVPSCAGFPPANEGFFGHVNMYPWIIPTAGALFFLFSRGWRWLHEDNWRDEDHWRR